MAVSATQIGFTLAAIMSNYPADQVLSPPDLPPYLESVYKLEPIVGVPTDDQVIGIHNVIRVANKVVEG